MPSNLSASRKLIGGLAFMSEPSSSATSSTDDTVDGGFFEEQRFAAAGRFHLPVGEFSDFEFGGDGQGDAGQFTGLFQSADEIVERLVSHARRLTEPV